MVEMRLRNRPHHNGLGSSHTVEAKFNDSFLRLSVRADKMPLISLHIRATNNASCKYDEARIIDSYSVCGGLRHFQDSQITKGLQV